MLENGYRERLANAQNSLSSLLLGLPTAPSKRIASPQLDQDPASLNSDGPLDAASLSSPSPSPSASSLPSTPISYSSAAKQVIFQARNVSSSSSPATHQQSQSGVASLMPTPALESNSASRHSFHQQQQQQHQQLYRHSLLSSTTSVLPPLHHHASASDLAKGATLSWEDVYPSLPSLASYRYSPIEPDSSIHQAVPNFGMRHGINDNSKHAFLSYPSKMDLTVHSTNASTTMAGGVRNVSNSLRNDYLGMRGDGVVAIDSLLPHRHSNSKALLNSSSSSLSSLLPLGPLSVDDDEIIAQAACVIQRAVRRFLQQRQKLYNADRELAPTESLSITDAGSTVPKTTQKGGSIHPSSVGRRQSTSSLLEGDGSQTPPTFRSILAVTTRDSSPHQQEEELSSSSSSTQESYLEELTRKCTRQAVEIEQLKELVAKLQRKAGEDHLRLQQKDREIEELKQQQQQQQQQQQVRSAVSFTPTGYDSLSRGKPSTTTTMTSSSSTTMPLLATGLSQSVSVSNLINAPSTVSSSSAGTCATGNLAADDYFETNISYAAQLGGPTASQSHAQPPPLPPLTIPSCAGSVHGGLSVGTPTSSQPNLSVGGASQSNSSTQLPQQGQALSINTSFAQTFTPGASSQSTFQYQGFMDASNGVIDSPSEIHTPLQGSLLMGGRSSSSTASSASSLNHHHGLHLHQQQQQQQHSSQYGSQSTFHPLLHRNSGSFSSSASRAFDSPALEQQGAYPWNIGAPLSHSQSWADDLVNGYDYGLQTSIGSALGGPGSDPLTPGIAHAASYDPTQQSFVSLGHCQPPIYSRSSGYRRHSDKSIHLDYQACVDRILQATDQQASIRLQQKLKTSPPDQKVVIIDAILVQAFPLMSNRFGNFLIQRCFEFGTPAQIDALAQAMRGNILTLACDPFGCHVVQKALDNVEEDWKARMVTEMFRRIPETIVHRYACHVWQKVFEIRWKDSPPTVMTYVNNAVAGRWAQVAVNETGSLVVQNIFENCAEHDKRPVINEILQSATKIAQGQWGNWVIQHILEYGSLADRTVVTRMILDDAVNLSLDQYASKVVEKTLRMAALQAAQGGATGNSAGILPLSVSPTTTIPMANTNSASNGNTASTPTAVTNNISTKVGTPAKGAETTITTTTPNHNTSTNTAVATFPQDVMGQYIQIVCEGSPGRPRIPLIDIAADQYGNYIIQYILTNARPLHRETCAALIKRHMVSLRGSKYGQKVAFMVERWRGFSGGGGGGGGGGHGHSRDNNSNNINNNHNGERGHGNHGGNNNNSNHNNHNSNGNGQIFGAQEVSNSIKSISALSSFDNSNGSRKSKEGGSMATISHGGQRSRRW